ncbi:hypothetical protein HYT00_02400 [Candidatus Giovannonibacteria bacterium]|nr:hypothetical protein [Candidatus Giovannonibacteria bacterium]
MNKTKSGENIGILGGGFVGQVLKKYWPKAKIFDIKPGEWDRPEDVLGQDYIFLSINFEDNCASFENRKIIEDYLAKVPDGKTIIIKSTLIPGTTDYFQNKFKKLNFCYNPEFLTEATAWDDFTNPTFQILGLNADSMSISDKLFSMLPKAQYETRMLSTEAEILKHAMNSFFATKVIFFNQLYDACLQYYADYEKISNILTEHPWIGDSHSIVWHKGYRGFGGKCLPKDTKAFAKVSGSSLLKRVLEINEDLKKNTFRLGDVSEKYHSIEM